MANKNIFDEKDTTVINTIVYEIRHSIETGKYKSEDKIIESELCKRFGISRTPVREAFRLLQNEGLLMHIPNRGVFVTKFGLDDIIYNFEVRSPLECLSARKAALFATEKDIENLHRINDELLAVNKEDPKQSTHLDNEFHLYISRINDNKYVSEFLESLIMRHRIIGFAFPISSERVKYTYKEHNDIITALERNDSELTEKYTNIHFVNSSRSAAGRVEAATHN